LPFPWNNLAAHNAVVTVIVVGLAVKSSTTKRLYEGGLVRECRVIGPYLVPDMDTVVTSRSEPWKGYPRMLFGNMPRDGGHLIFTDDEARPLRRSPDSGKYIKQYVGSEEFINGKQRYCLWIHDTQVNDATAIQAIAARLTQVSENRSASKAASTRGFATRPHRFVQIQGLATKHTIIVPAVSSESREYLPVGLLGADTIVSNSAFAIYDAPVWNLALIASRLHLVWIATVCGKLETRYRYSNTLGWNTFPVPELTDKNKQDLTRAAEEILLAREGHYPATIAELYDPETMPDDLRLAHEHNDEVLERIFIGRRFRNDTERLEKLFELYSKMVAAPRKGAGVRGSA